MSELTLEYSKAEIKIAKFRMVKLLPNSPKTAKSCTDFSPWSDHAHCESSLRYSHENYIVINSSFATYQFAHLYYDLDHEDQSHILFSMDDYVCA